jgi:broad specificity phosphatase PhoE
MTGASFDLQLLRHAGSAAPKSHAVGQWNVPLSAQGVDDLTQRVQGWSDPMPTRIVCSDLARARATARAIAVRFGQPLAEDPGWREVGLGQWERRRWADLERDDGARVARWDADWRTVAPPGGEAWPDVIERVRQAFDRLAAVVNPGEQVLVVAHVGAIRAFLVGVANCPEEAALEWPLPLLGGVKARVTLARDPSGRWPIELAPHPTPSGSA